MVEAVIIQYLNRVLNVPVHAEEPEDKPMKYVLVEKVGSAETNYINTATITLQSYAESMNVAAELNEAVKMAMDNIIAYEEISKSKLNSDYNYTDTTKKRYRYQAVYEIVY